MTTSTQHFILRLAALLLAAALLLTDRLQLADVPMEAWVALAGVIGLTVKRSGDTSPHELARLLESRDPTSPSA